MKFPHFRNGNIKQHVIHKYKFSSLGSNVKLAKTSSSLSRKLVMIEKQLDRSSENDLYFSSLYTMCSRNVLGTSTILQENYNRFKTVRVFDTCIEFPTDNLIKLCWKEISRSFINLLFLMGLLSVKNIFFQGSIINLSCWLLNVNWTNRFFA